MPPFDAFSSSVRPQSPLRAAITAATRRRESECLPDLLQAAGLDPVRRRAAPAGGVQGLIREYGLSSQ